MFDKISLQIFDVLQEGIVIVDKEGIVIYINTFAAIMDGIDRTSCIGRQLVDVYPSLNNKSSTLLKVIKTREPITNNEQTYRNYKGELLVTTNCTYPIFIDKRFLGAVGISRPMESEKFRPKEFIEVVPNYFIDKTNKINNRGTAKFDFMDIIGSNEILLKVKEKAYKASKTNSPVLVHGETGTGKELFVHAIHNNSNRKYESFIAQNCAAIPVNLLEGILFGTVKGSFTGSENKKGLFELADKGTLYLDELNSMPMDLQAKLLRVLQDGTMRRVGETTSKIIDVRVIVSLNEEPEKAIENGHLRKDLFYRLNVVSIELPPLRKRKEDIPLLIKNFISKFNNNFQAQVEGIEESAVSKLISLEWDGNIRELEHLIECIFNLKQSGIITLEDVEDLIEGGRGKKEHSDILPLKERLEEAEENYIKEAMAISNNNISKAARLLSIPRQTLQHKINKFKRRGSS